MKAPARLSPAHNFHLTLKFLGEIPPEKVEVVKQCLSKIEFKKFSATVNGLGVFPSESYVWVVWAGLEPEEGFIDLQRKIDHALENEFPHDKNFRPHLTLARVKSISDKALFAEHLKSMKIAPVAFPVDNFKLKKSTLSPKGAVYEDIAVYQASLST